MKTLLAIVAALAIGCTPPPLQSKQALFIRAKTGEAYIVYVDKHGGPSGLFAGIKPIPGVRYIVGSISIDTTR